MVFQFQRAVLKGRMTVCRLVVGRETSGLPNVCAQM
jgi:hypothetical protein